MNKGIVLLTARRSSHTRVKSQKWNKVDFNLISAFTKSSMQIEEHWPGGHQVPALINPSRPAEEQRLTRLINFKSLIELDDWGIRTQT